MTAGDWSALVLVLVAFALAGALAAWSPAGRRLWAPVSLALLMASGLLVATAPELNLTERGPGTTLIVLAGLLALAGGGPLTTLVFDLVDRREAREESLDRAGLVLRGGAWIGGLERIAVFAALAAGWPEGLAITLALKGLGRYPELRAAEDGVRTGAAERFIIGTFTSVLWAAGCAAVVLLAT